MIQLLKGAKALKQDFEIPVKNRLLFYCTPLTVDKKTILMHLKIEKKK